MQWSNKFIFLLRKGVYSYEYMDSWEKFNETLLPDKETFYSNLNIEDITDVDYKHAKIVFKNLINKNLRVEKGIRGGICHAIHRYAKANNKYMVNYNKDEEESFLEYLRAKHLYGLAMSEPLPVDGFDFIKDLPKIDEDFIKKLR